MNVFVTGGNGFIGSRVTAALVGRGHQVRCLLRPTSDTRRIDHLPCERVVGEVRDRASLERGLRGCQGCVHLAGPSSWSEIASPEVEPVIVGGTRMLLEAAAALPGLRLVFVSSAAAVNGSRRPEVFDETATFGLAGSGLTYAIAKHEAERLVFDAVARGLEAVVVCPAETYGPDDHEWVTAGALRDAISSWPALAVRGGTAVAHVDDVAEGIVAAFERGRPGERYILGGENLTVGELTRLALAVAGLRKPVVTLPGWVVRAAVAACAALRISPPVPPGVVGYALRYWFVSCDKARDELGYRPRPAEDTLRSVLEWMASAAAAEARPGRDASGLPTAGSGRGGG
jgi:dihydroflavonol-4-reductase